MANHVIEETCSRAAVAHGGHLWLWHDRWRRCPGIPDPDAPIASELTVDLLIAKYTGREDGLRAQLRGYHLGARERESVQARADETNDFLTDLRRLRAAGEG